MSFDKDGTRREVQPRVSQYEFGSSVTLYIIGRINNVSNPMMEYVNNQTDSLVWPSKCVIKITTSSVWNVW